MSHNAQAAASFLGRNCSDGLTNLVCIAADRSILRPGARPIISFTFDPRTEQPALAEFIRKQDGLRNVYFGPNPVRGRLTKKATKDDIAELRFVYVDIDPRAGADLDTDRARIRGLIERYPCRPQMVVDSGNGYQLYWRLPEPLAADGNVEMIEAVNRYLELALGGDSCHNADRVLRVPFTYNLPNRKKQAAGRQKVLAKVEWEEEGAVDLETLRAAHPTFTAKFSDLLSSSPQFRARWEGGTEGLTDDSRSGRDMSVLAMLAKSGYDKATSVAILHDFPFGNAAAKDDRYVDRMWDKVSLPKTPSHSGFVRPPQEAVVDLDAIVDEWNKRYAVVQQGSSAFILEEKPDGGHATLSLKAFQLINSNVILFDGKRAQPVTQAWLKHPRRRELRGGVVFHPGEKGPADAYNLWRGFAVTAGTGNYGIFLDHILNNVCGGDARLNAWLIGWMAQMIQTPQRKLGTGICLIGNQGTGKSVVGAVLGKLLGPHYRQVASGGLVTGRFNRHLAALILLQCDEAVFAGDKPATNVLKDLVTSSSLQLEAKGVDVCEVPNYIRLLLTTNSDWALNAAAEERRFCVIRVGDQRQQDTNYFSKMFEQLEQENGYGGLLAYLLAYPVDETSLRSIPMTTALAEQKVLSMRPEAAWWYGILERGVLPGDTAGLGVSPNALMYQDYVAGCQNAGVLRRGFDTALGTLLNRLYPTLTTVQRKYYDPQRQAHVTGRVRELPSLQDCRSAFATAFFNLPDWSGPKDWACDVTPEFAREEF